MSYPLRPLFQQQDPPQEDQQQHRQPSVGYSTYNNSDGYPLPQVHHHHQQQYPQYLGPYQWQAAGYLRNGAAAAGQPYYGPPHPHPPSPPTKSPFGDENASNYSYAGSTGVPSSGYPHSPATQTVASQPPKAAAQVVSMCGTKRNYCFILLAIGSFVLVLGIALGVGLGVTMNHHSSPSDNSNATATQTAPPAPSFTGTLVSAPVTCPHDNNTVYLSSPSPSPSPSSSSASKPFNIECGRDYNSNDGAKDIGDPHTGVAHMSDCIDLCGARDGCVGVGYGNYQGSMTCWLKSRLGQPNSSPSWYAARLQHVE